MLSAFVGALVLCAAGSAGSAGGANSLLLQPDGKIVVAGWGQRGARDVFGLARYTPSGSLDTSFGLRGKVTVPFGDRAAAAAAALQPDGKVVATGFIASGLYSNSWNFGVARYMPGGKLDPTFGSAGRVATKFGSIASSANALALQPDGKVVVAGQLNGPGSRGIALARYRADGSLDQSFSTDGQVTTLSGTDAAASAVALQPDGKIIVAGTAPGHFAVVRYEPDGSLDPTFGTDGLVTTSVGVGAGGNALALEPGGKIVVAGGGGSEFVLARYNSDGSLDLSFGSGGTVRTPFIDCAGSDYCGSVANALALQGDGKIVAAGQTCIGQCSFALARYNPDGSLDAGFGSAGKVTTSFGYPSPEMGEVWGDYAQALALQTDGKIVAAGYSQFGPHVEQSGVALARYLPNGSLDASFGAGGQVKTSLAVCVVANVVHHRMDWFARQRIKSAHCAVGKITRVHSHTVRRRRIISERPRPGKVHVEGTKVRLLVSLGRR